MIRIFVLLTLFSSLFSGFESLAQAPAPGPIKVEMRQENGQWQLYRGGKPYYIKGVGGQSQMDRAVTYGANSIRTWGASEGCLLYTSPSPRDLSTSRMPSSA